MKKIALLISLLTTALSCQVATPTEPQLPTPSTRRCVEITETAIICLTYETTTICDTVNWSHWECYNEKEPKTRFEDAK